jgi:hypothetical protein
VLDVAPTGASTAQNRVLLQFCLAPGSGVPNDPWMWAPVALCAIKREVAGGHTCQGLP